MINLLHNLNPRKTWPKAGPLHYGRIGASALVAAHSAVDSLFRKRL